MVTEVRKRIQLVLDTSNQKCSCARFAEAEQAYFDLISRLKGFVPRATQDMLDESYSRLLICRFGCLHGAQPDSCPRGFKCAPDYSI